MDMKGMTLLLIEKYLKSLRDLRLSHNPPPPCSDKRAVTPHEDAEIKLVLIFHDESIFHANEGQFWVWGMPDQPIIQPKLKGSGIMVSDYIEQTWWLSKLTAEELCMARKNDPEFPESACALLEYGGEKDGY